jgi:hypothetical protein
MKTDYVGMAHSAVELGTLKDGDVFVELDYIQYNHTQPHMKISFPVVEDAKYPVHPVDEVCIVDLVNGHSTMRRKHTKVIPINGMFKFDSFVETKKEKVDDV